MTKTKHSSPSLLDRLEELSTWHKNSNDFLNSGSLFDQRTVSNAFPTNLSLTMATVKFGDVDAPKNKPNYLTVNSGLLTNWKDYQPYNDPQRQRWATIVSGEKTHALPGGDVLSAKATAIVVPSDGKGKTLSFFSPEVKYTHHATSVGAGAIASQIVANNMYYAFGEAQGYRVSVGAYTHSTLEPQQHPDKLRVMASKDLPLATGHALQLFSSYEAGAHGEIRAGAIYQAKIGKASLRSDVIFNSQTAQHIENVNVKADIPFTLNDNGKRTVQLIANGFIGGAGGFETEANPNPSFNLVYGAGITLKSLKNKAPSAGR